MIEVKKIFKKIFFIITVPFLLIITVLSVYNMKKFNNHAIKYQEYNTYYINLTTRQQKEINILKNLLAHKNAQDKINTAKYYADSWHNYQMLRLCHAAEAKTN
jgi:hypothetical protein